MLKPEPSPGEVEFEPTIVAFLCNWCSYAGADLAGTQRLTYPANVRVIRVMCSGRVDPGYVVQCLLSGADGVLVSGCHHGDCHYVCGNRIAERRVAVTRRLLEFIGVEPQRVRLTWISGAEGRRFARVIEEMVRELKALGPFHGFEASGRRAS